MAATRGTTNRNDRGSPDDRRRRREWLVETFRADVDLSAAGCVCRDAGCPFVPVGTVPIGLGKPACRCYRCGTLLTVQTVTVDRITPGAKGGTYRRNNIRPACSHCNSETGAQLMHSIRRARIVGRRGGGHL